MDKAAQGLFGISEDHIEKYQSLDQRFIKNRASTFFFEAECDSMSPLILSGDTLVVDRSIKAGHGHIVIASLGSEMFCRRLVYKDQNIILRAENLNYSDMLIKNKNDFSIFGVVRSIVREFI